MLVLAHLSMVSAKGKVQAKMLKMKSCVSGLCLSRIRSLHSVHLFLLCGSRMSQAAAFSGVISCWPSRFKRQLRCNSQSHWCLWSKRRLSNTGCSRLCHPNASVDVLSDPGGLGSGFEWACSGTSDLVYATR